jgi:site-specific recombinase XerD
MLEKSFSLLFYLKKPKNYVKGEMPIYLRITVDGIPKEISTGRSCDHLKWNSNAGRCNGTKEDVKTLNAFLDTLQTKVYEVRRQLLEKNETITSDALKSVLKGRNENAKMILKIFQQHNDEVQSLIGKDFSASTLERYNTSFDHTKAFILWKYGVSDMDVRKLDFEFISQYEFWLKTVRNCNHNSTIKYLANFRKIVNRCIRNGWLERDPFVGFKMTKKEVIPEFLSDHELKLITEKRFVSNRLEQVRDIFLFCCYTGLAFADVKKLKASEIGIGIDGDRWIFTSRQKTETATRVPLLPVALEILDKFKDDPQCLNSGRALPVLSNQKYNSYLKEIADVCGINKKLTTHTARHTFATTVTLGNGVPIESVSKMLGHTNLKTTQHYAKVLDKKISDDMNALRNKMSKTESNKLKVV